MYTSEEGQMMATIQQQPITTANTNDDSKYTMTLSDEGQWRQAVAEGKLVMKATNTCHKHWPVKASSSSQPTLSLSRPPV